MGWKLVKKTDDTTVYACCDYISIVIDYNTKSIEAIDHMDNDFGIMIYNNKPWKVTDKDIERIKSIWKDGEEDQEEVIK